MPEQSLEQISPDAKQPDDKQEAPYTLRSFLGDALDIAEAAVLTVFLFLLVFAYILRPVTVDGSSMKPTLYDEDQLLVFNTPFGPKNGNIVVIDDQKSGLFADPEQHVVFESNGLGIVIIKRLIAQGGQEVNIDFENGTVAVDGQQLVEPYIADLTTRNDGAFSYPLTVPEGYLFVMGDNRLGSTDSRNPAVALVPADQVVGVAVARYGRNAELITSWTDRFDWLL